MKTSIRRTKIVATIGPSSNTPEMLRNLIQSGMDVARLNFSHGTHEDHAAVIRHLRDISIELDKPVTILQDLQGPKIRVGQVEGGQMMLDRDARVSLVPDMTIMGGGSLIPIDYPHLADEAKPGMQVLLDDGLLEMVIEKITKDQAVVCKVVEGGILKSRKGVNFPDLSLKLPSLTSKDKKDLDFGLEQGVDWISLSFVRSATDIRALRSRIEARGYKRPIIAKIEKPQAIADLDSILEASDAIMVARGDLGVELSPERVPLIQKRIIESCNRLSKPVITATQMLESMIHEPRPTRAEASDVANAIIDGTDCIMLSGETAAGAFPVKAVEMMVRIACEVEKQIQFKKYPPSGNLEIMALSETTNIIEKVVNARCIAVLTTTGNSARFVASERPDASIYAITSQPQVYHALNLLWGIKPLLINEHPESFEGLVSLVEKTLLKCGAISSGDKVIILGGVPSGTPGGTNFIKIHTIS